MQNFPEAGAYWRISLQPETDPRLSSLSEGEQKALEICSKLGMLPYQYYCRSIHQEGTRLILADAFQYGVLPDEEREIIMEYRRDVGDIHLESLKEIPVDEVPEASWMITNEEDARIGLAREKEIFPEKGSHPTELLATSIPLT